MNDTSQADARPIEDRRGNDKENGASGGRVMTMVKVIILLAGISFALVYLVDRSHAQRSDDRGRGQREQGFDAQISGNAQRMMEEGRRIFRFDTFGDEIFWTDKLKLHRAIEGAKLGGVGPGVSPKTALAVGLKVDMDALPAELVEKIKRGEVNMDDPATTLALI